MRSDKSCRMEGKEYMLEKAYQRLRGGEKICAKLKSAFIGGSDAKGILTRAEQEVKGYLILPGTGNQPYFVGNPPKWRENPVNDEEYTWSLNRMGPWKDYMVAYAFTEERKYAEKILEELTDWMEQCPCPAVSENPDELRAQQFTITPWRTLEAGIRMFDTWPDAVKLLIQEGFMDLELFSKTVECIAEHAGYLKNVSPILWPDADHNHYLMENLGLLCSGVMLRELPEAEEWIEHANRELERCAVKQLTEDGGQIEGSPLYHNQTIIYFCKWLLTAKTAGIAVSEECRQRIRKGLDYSIYAVRPMGEGVPFGDSDAEYGAMPASILGWFVFEDAKWISLLKNLMGEEKFWRICSLYPFELRTLEKPFAFTDIAKLSFPVMNWQKKLSQVAMRSDWTHDALSAFSACRIPCQNGHSHIDPSSFDFCAYGAALAVDPGRYTYREGADRRLFKSAAMHNTLTLDGKEPFQYETRWTFADEKDGCIFTAEQGERYQMAVALQTSYFPVIHERLLALIDGSFLLVWDRLFHCGNGQRVDIWLNLDSTTVVQKDGVVMIGGHPGAAIRGSEGLEISFHEGWVSEQTDVKRKTTRVCFTDPHTKEGTRNYVSILVPFREKPPEISAVRQETEQRVGFSVNGKPYRIRWSEEQFEIDEKSYQEP